MTNTQTGAELFAAYVEVVEDSDPARRHRRQWVILPPLPARHAPGDSPITEHFVWFEREQRSANHRAVWSYHQDLSGDLSSNLMRILRNYEVSGWRVTVPDGGILTCEIHPTELAAIIREPKTPYRILKRFEKVARSKYGLNIA